MVDPGRRAVAGLVVGVVGIVAALGMGVALALEGDDGGAYRATEAGFVEEPSGEIGPDAFTPPVDTDDERVCDQDRLVEELDGRPEAKRAWAAVLGISEDAVGDYVRSLEAEVLPEDTMVTNHGLHDGVAYARPSVLEAGTAVLVSVVPPESVDGDGTEPSPTETTATTVEQPTETTTEVPTTTVAPGMPVTRCKCGNPLLAPYAPSAPGEPTTTTTTTTEPTTGPAPTEPSQPPPMEVEPPPEPDEPSEPMEPMEPEEPNGPPPDTPDQDTPMDGNIL